MLSVARPPCCVCGAVSPRLREAVLVQCPPRRHRRVPVRRDAVSAEAASPCGGEAEPPCCVRRYRQCPHEAGPPLRSGRSDVGGAGQARRGAGRGPGLADRCAQRGCGSLLHPPRYHGHPLLQGSGGETAGGEGGPVLVPAVGRAGALHQRGLPHGRRHRRALQEEVRGRPGAAGSTEEDGGGGCSAERREIHLLPDHKAEGFPQTHVRDHAEEFGSHESSLPAQRSHGHLHAQDWMWTRWPGVGKSFSNPWGSV